MTRGMLGNFTHVPSKTQRKYCGFAGEFQTKLQRKTYGFFTKKQSKMQIKQQIKKQRKQQHKKQIKCKQKSKATTEAKAQGRAGMAYVFFAKKKRKVMPA